MERTYEDYEKVIKECERQFKLMDDTTKNMDVAREFQEITLKHAQEKIKAFPKPAKEKKEKI